MRPDHAEAFARLLQRAYGHRLRIREQQGMVDAAIADGSREALCREQLMLTVLTVEREVLGHRLRSVFDG